MQPQTSLLMVNDIIILALSVLPVIILGIYVYKKDKFNKEPLWMIIKAFCGGILSIPIALSFDSTVAGIIPGEGAFYNAFFQAGITEEVAKWMIFMIFIWKSRHFDEYIDGIVYACFISLGFACIENILYVFNTETFTSALGTSFMRGVLAVPAHFLFAVIMGYYLAMAKFGGRMVFNLALSLIFPIIAHGTYDFLLMFTDTLEKAGLEFLIFVIFAIFIYFDIKLWKIGIKRITNMMNRTQIEHNNTRFKDIFK